MTLNIAQVIQCILSHISRDIKSFLLGTDQGVRDMNGVERNRLEAAPPIGESSANPITRDRSEVMINASWGLGESIVGGTVTPDTFIVRKSDLGIINCAIADKQRMTVSVPGGTREVDVPRFLRNISSLNDEQVIEMAKLALTLGVTVKHPVDVECAYAAGDLYLLQCRLIATLR